MLNKTVTNSAPTNLELNRTLWDNYARTWNLEKPWIKQMITDVAQVEKAQQGKLILGEEWSDDASFLQVLDNFVIPYISAVAERGSKVLEIGVGGGRVAVQVAPLLPVSSLICLDISEEMLKHAKKNLKHLEHLDIKFVQ